MVAAILILAGLNTLFAFGVVWILARHLPSITRSKVYELAHFLHLGHSVAARDMAKLDRITEKVSEEIVAGDELDRLFVKPEKIDDDTWALAEEKGEELGLPPVIALQHLESEEREGGLGHRI